MGLFLRARPINSRSGSGWTRSGLGCLHGPGPDPAEYSPANGEHC